MIASKNCLVITTIILDNVWKIWIELIEWIIHKAGEKFYLMQAFPKVRNLVEILKISKFFENDNSIDGGAPALRYSSGNQVDGSPLVAI